MPRVAAEHHSQPYHSRCAAQTVSKAVHREASMHKIVLADGRALGTIREIMSKYDRNGDGFIEQEELADLLADCDQGQSPSQEEVQYFHRVGDNHDGIADGKLRKIDLEHAIHAWLAYKLHRADIDAMFQKHDQNQNGTLDSNACTSVSAKASACLAACMILAQAKRDNTGSSIPRQAGT